MSKKRKLSFLLVLSMLLTLTAGLGTTVQAAPEDLAAPLVLQDLDYTENPVDVPNPDRGFERGNDDAAGQNTYGYMTIPASADTILGQPFQLCYELNPPFYLGGVGRGPEYCNVPVEPRIVQFYLVLNNFSSNAWCDSTPGTPSAHTRVGVDGPITEYGLQFLRDQFEFIRTQTNSVAHIRVCYDPKGWNQIVWNANNLKYNDGTTTPVTDLAAHIAKPGAGTWRGSSPIFRMCTVPGFEDLNWVQYHYLQLKPIFHEYSDVIWAFDSGTFGPWGETHSCYEAEVPGHYKIVLDSLLDAVPDGKPIMTHVGGFLDWYNRTYDTTYDFGTLETLPAPVRGTPEARFGMFDDSNGWSVDEYSYGDNGSLTEGYRMLAHDPLLPGYNPTGADPSLRSAGIDPVIGYNDSGTNRLLPVPENLTDARWRGVWFADWDRTKFMTHLGKMSVYGGEQIGNEPGLISGARNNGGYAPIGSRLNSPYNNVILRFPSMFFEHSIARYTYLCMQQGSGSFLSRANYPYTQDEIDIEITYPWSGQKVKVIYDPVYEGQSALAYYRDRLGYRLVLREAKASAWAEQNGMLNFEGKIQNVGWGEVFNKKDVKVLLKNKATGLVSDAVLTGLDPYDWQPADIGPTDSPLLYGSMPDSRATNTDAWRDLSFSVDMAEFGDVPAGDYDIYLKINDPKETTASKRSIRFANNGDNWDESLGANLIGQTTVITDKVKVNLSADTISYISGDVEYTVSLECAKDVLAVELEFVIDGSMLAGKGLEGLNGFGSMNNVLWVYAGDGMWKGTVTLDLPSGTTTGLTSDESVDIAKFIYTPKGFGNAAMTLTSARVVGLLGDTTRYIASAIKDGTATTVIAKSKYDLNRDGVVDALDLGIMLLYCGFIEDTADWGALVKVNDTWGNGVTASMCDVNGDGIIDMLDLLDLFIHYTK